MYSQDTLDIYKDFVSYTNKKSKKSKKWYYNLLDIIKEFCYYYMIFGIRSNGKTTSVYILALIDYCLHGKQLALIRRWDTDFKGKAGTEMFANLCKIEYKDMLLIEYLTNGKYNTIVYYSSKWYLAKFDNELNKIVRDTKPFCLAFGLNVAEHDKSVSFPDIKTTLFDEFITRTQPLKDEFIVYMNTLSTIIRDNDDVINFMCGNTVNKTCPHFREMGLYNISKMKPDSVEYYIYGDTKLKVGVEYVAIKDNKSKTKSKPSDVYFAFDNPKLKMITTGTWEIDIYPHLPYKYIENDIKFIFFIAFETTLLQCECIRIKRDLFIYIHQKTTPLQNTKKDLIYSQEITPHPNYSRNLTKPRNPREKKIWFLFQTEKVFYQDNEIGEIVRNYLQWCKQI